MIVHPVRVLGATFIQIKLGALIIGNAVFARPFRNLLSFLNLLGNDSWDNVDFDSVSV